MNEDIELKEGEEICQHCKGDGCGTCRGTGKRRMQRPAGGNGEQTAEEESTFEKEELDISDEGGN